ncbi:MAG TPA: gamma-glutamyl-phosphate reductase, partial [Terrimesophilobacter sp.]|nr:gamma-glutamyl-phosphate reductase [Terrimesophilobacter sp.]
MDTALTAKLKASREASLALAAATTSQKNAALEAIAVAVAENASAIIDANEGDLAAGRESGVAESLLDRLG